METSHHKIPVTILTGFLGSGKTTLLNRVLSEAHGKKIAVIENEYGELSIDHELVINADEEIFEMANGCICCTVRGDLIRILGSLIKRRKSFDYVLVETTGLADPGPVAQTFFMDEEIQEAFSLDGIITMVDAAHLEQQLGRSEECEEQLAFADVVVLNKCDLVEPAKLDELEARIRSLNKMAKLYRSEQAQVPVEAVLNLGAFNLDEALERRPSFLEPEYPFEWTGIWELEAGRYVLELAQGPDPTMSMFALPMGARAEQQQQQQQLVDGAERCVRLMAYEAKALRAGEEISWDEHLELELSGESLKRFRLTLREPMTIALYTQHTAQEFELKLKTSPKTVKLGTLKPWHPAPQRRLKRPPSAAALYESWEERAPALTRTWVAQHEHDDEVSSVSIEVEGDVDPDRLNMWFSRLLRERGADIFRMKGFISIAQDPRRFVFQGVHMLLDGKPERLWGEQRRRNQLVFIGRHLDQEVIEAGFKSCLS